ncbi:hypothetical protein IC229_10495 [Spirosoma sp. BT702]|uniref:Phage tail protein n=1 Tax=Spirosoma profusum TaxID=2771354 RepID=A0A926XVG8_9BACT|nr:type VI secretion system tube protein TssD [Spirosoma profusum]MBD2701064.1 hypothetical protein [Spirosoma profusum]
MASYRAELEIDGGDPLPIKRLFFTATRKRDANGRPASSTSWRVLVALDTAEDNTFTQWMIDPKSQKDVTVKYRNIEDDSVLKQWELKKAYCYGMKESFVGDAMFMVTDLLVAGQEVTNGNATLKYEWK